MSRNHIAGSCDRLFILRTLWTDFQSGWTSLHSNQQSIKFPLSSHSQQDLMLFVFLTVSVVTGMRKNVKEVLICICLLDEDVEDLFKSLLHICISCVENLNTYSVYSWKSSIEVL